MKSHRVIQTLTMWTSRSCCRQYLDQRHGDRVQSAWNIASSSDVTLLLIDAHRQLFRPDTRVVDLVEQFRDHIHADKYKDNTESSPGENSSTGLVLTKMDKVEAQQDTLECNRMIQEMTLLGKFENIFKISALRGECLYLMRVYDVTWKGKYLVCACYCVGLTRH